MNPRSDLAELLRRVRQGGIVDVGRRVLRRLSDRFDVDSLDFPLFMDDIADSTRLTCPHRQLSGSLSAPVTVGWICTPPAAGSGGHTTLFRMIAGMEGRGHRCVLYLYDRHRGDFERHVRVIRDYWPQLRAEVRDATEGIVGVDACVAGSWETAHVLVSRSAGPMARLYFIQDFEPFFYPRGTLYALAEDTYRFGLRNIALGQMVARLLGDLDIECNIAPFGCDTSVYSLSETGPRKGVIFYTKPATDRRGYLLGKLALEEFHRRHPDQDIHVYGSSVKDWKIPIVRHQRLLPAELNALYNRTIAGLAMSFTNISLVAEEMLAAGTVPIVNDSPYARADLSNEHVEWAAPTPGGIADALSRVIEDPAIQAHAAAAAHTVRQGWGAAQQVVEEIILDEVRRSVEVA